MAAKVYEMQSLIPKEDPQKKGQQHHTGVQQQQQTGQLQQQQPQAGQKQGQQPQAGQQQPQAGQQQPQAGQQQPQAGQQQPQAGQQQPQAGQQQPQAGQQQPQAGQQQPQAGQQQPQAGQQQPQAGQQRPQPQAGQRLQQSPGQPQQLQSGQRPTSTTSGRLPVLRQKTECKAFVPDGRDLKEGVNGTKWLCVCGRGIDQHQNKPTGLNLQKFLREEYVSKETIGRLKKEKLRWKCIGTLELEQKEFGGDIHFKRRKLIAKKTADLVKFQRLADDNKMTDVVKEVLKGSWQLDALLQETWKNQECGSLAISVCGDIANGTKRETMYKLIGDSVMKAATVVNGLIITPGKNGSIAQAIGHSLEDTKRWQKVQQDQRRRWLGSQSQSEHQEKIIPCVFCVGITSWNTVQNKECLTKKLPDKSFYDYSDFHEDDPRSENCLNACHTHFLLFDDGRIKPNPGYPEKVAELTAMFLEQLNKSVANKDQPIIPVQILVGGQDIANIRLMKEALKYKIPVVLCYGSGGVTDVIVEQYVAWTSGQVSESGLPQFERECKDRLQRIEYTSDSNAAAKQICDTFTDDSQGFNILWVCDLRAGEEVTVAGAERELDSAILKASLKKTKRHNKKLTEATDEELVKYRSEYLTQLKLAIHWRKFGLADELIFPELNSFIMELGSGHTQVVELKKGLTGILKDCLMKDLSEFVDALLVIDDESLLTSEVICDLFKYEPKRDPLKDIYVRKKFGEAGRTTSDHVKSMIDTLILPHRQYCLSEETPDYKGLLIGAVLAQSWQVVHFVLRLIAAYHGDSLTSTLAVAYLCKKIANKQWDNDIKLTFKEKSRHFVTLSIEMLEYLHRTHPEDLSTVLEEESRLWSPYTPKEMAEEGNFKEFLSSEPVNAEVRVEWSGQDCKSACVCDGPQFSPHAKFYSHMVAFLAMLIAWSSFLVWGFTHEGVGVFEICVLIWTFSYWISRCRSWHFTFKRSGMPINLQLKTRRHLKCFEVVLVSGLLIAGLTCHLLGESEGSRALYCILCCMLIIRLVHFMKAYRFFSTQISIIFHVAVHVLSFLCFTVVLIWSGGILFSGLLCVNTSADVIKAHGNETHPVRLRGTASLQNVVDLAWYLYLALYGEFSFSLTADDDLACVARKSVVLYTVYILLGIYILIGNVLLLNLLVSMFESVSQSVSASANAIWKRNWYILLQRYKEETILPPPFNVFEYSLAAIKKCCLKIRGRCPCCLCACCRQCCPGEDDTDYSPAEKAQYLKKIHVELANLLMPE